METLLLFAMVLGFLFIGAPVGLSRAQEEPRAHESAQQILALYLQLHEELGVRTGSRLR